MRRVSVALAALAFALAGCTFLVSFAELPDDDAVLGGPDARPRNNDVSVPDGDPPDVPVLIADDAVAPDATVDYSDACAGQLDGKYCNGNKVNVDAGSRDDLVTCLNAMTVSANLCVNGCTRMPSGFPDECDQCQGKATGLYCGDDFFNWHPLNKNTRIRCDNGAIVGNLICSNGCTGTGPNAACAP
jgi:hypothetical protein